ncbi:hypothetical protein VaNZ11_014131 [Volvox africanus]|uniref:Cap-specific mRNA (nucleoside-2'-O-)-methyltransferase 2 n=1 Tax=Volvox africanus TaxID=51714 RepID=A0ABQ5SHR0_9CHLO|nr:hypothetical protein VaNZ11_014131 [Volvox africanus]
MSRQSRGGGGFRQGGQQRTRERVQMQQMQPNVYYDTHYAKALEMMQRTVHIDTSGCQLPALGDFFSSTEWELSDLVSNRDQLNQTKNSLNDWDRRRWERAAADANPADQVRAMLRNVYHVELGTVAWAKMYETIWQCDMMPPSSPAVPNRERGSPKVVSVHLCEAPGAFIAATNHFVKTHRTSWQWDWMAVSLNPYCEANDKFAMVEDDALIAATTPKWCFGADSTGDIRRIPNIKAIWERGRWLCQQMGCPGGALMVTADGAVDTSMDPNRQEIITASLHYCEVVAALGLLAVGGNFVWKGFTLYEHPSICSLYLMGCLFDQVLVYKPATSKPANSEVYVVGKGFRGVPQDVLELLLTNCGEDVFTGRSLFPLERLPEDFLETARNAAIYFGNATADAIKEAVELEGLPAPVKRDSLRRAKEAFAEHWCSKLQMKDLARSQYLVPDTELDGRRNNTSAKRKCNELTGNLAERQEQYRKRTVALGRLDSRAQEDPGGGDNSDGDGGGGGLGLGRRIRGAGSSAGGGGANEMHVSSKAAAMMAKMGHVEGKGLGRTNQGIAATLEMVGNRQRAGLGLSLGAADVGTAGVPPNWSLAPDSAMLACPGSLTKAETDAWAPLSDSVAPPPPQIIKSKMLDDDDVLVALRVARREFCNAAVARDGKGICRHMHHCVAPRRLSHASRSYWKLAAVDSALDVCRVVSDTAARNDELPSALDLSLLGGAGGTEYLIFGVDGVRSDWHVVALNTDRAREFAVASPAGDLTAEGDPRVRLLPLPPHTSTSPKPLELCTADSAREIAAAASGCWLVVGDLGSLRRLQHSGTGVLEGELSPAYRRAVLWEVAITLGCLAPGGCAVIRLGGCLTMFSASVLYILHRCFAKLAVVKPFACCACSSERLVVAIGCLYDVEAARQRVLEALKEVANVEMPLPDSQLPAMVLTELAPAGVMMRSKEFLRYMERRTTALAEREVKHCKEAVEVAAKGGPLPSSEELTALGQHAESMLRGEALPPPSSVGTQARHGAGTDDEEILKRYGGVFTRGGLGSDAVGSDQAKVKPKQDHDDGAAYGMGPVLHHSQRPQPPHHHGHQQQQRGSGRDGGGRGESPMPVVFRLLTRSEKGDEFICCVRCELMPDVATRTKLDCADGVVAVRYCYRDDCEPQHHFQTSWPLLPESDADTVRLGRLMAFLANSRRPDGREKVAVLAPLQPNGADDDEGWGGAVGHGRAHGRPLRRMCVSLQGRDAVDPSQAGLMLWC